MSRIGNVGLLLLTIVAFMSLGGSPRAQVSPVDHYKCYVIDPPFPFSGPFTLVDQFNSQTANSLISRLLCAPVSKEGSQVNNPDIHLKAYEIVPALPPLDPPVLVNLFPLNDHLIPESNVRVIQPLFLLVPTIKVLVPPANERLQ